MSQGHKIHTDSSLPASSAAIRPLGTNTMSELHGASDLVHGDPSHGVSKGQRDFFANEPGLVQVFEVDHEKYNQFETQVTMYADCCCCFVVPGCLYYWACDKQNVYDRITATHVAVTQDGIKFVVDHHARCCRLECMNVGKVSKTVPFDKITDCDIEEPGGASCCGLVPNVLYAVHVDTASSKGTHELSLLGLKDPRAFKELVWSMKRGQASLISAAGGHDGAHAAGLHNSLQSFESIDRRLREGNELLQQLVAIKQQQQASRRS